MNEKELYRQKAQALLDERKADIAKLKARASGAKADVQIAMNNEIAALERKLEDAQEKLTELAEASEEAWKTVNQGVESAWDSLTSAIRDAASKFKE